MSIEDDVASSFFRAAAISQGIAMRAKPGNASGGKCPCTAYCPTRLLEV
jgi:hypothetical protein